MTGQRYLQTSAQTGAVDGGHDRLLRCLEPAHRLLALEAQPLGLGLVGDGGELLDVGTRNEGVRLARDQYHRANRGLARQPAQERLHLGLDRAVQLVHRLTRQVEGDHGDAGFNADCECGRSSSRGSRV
jgi:hypothetical protein